MIAHLLQLPDDELAEVLDLVLQTVGEREVDLDAFIALCGRGLVAPATRRAVGTYVLDIDGRGDHLDVLQRKLRALRDDAPVDDDHRASVVVQAVAVAALLVRVQVDAASLQVFVVRRRALWCGKVLAFIVASFMSSTRRYSLRSS